MGILDGILRRPRKMTAEEYMKKCIEKGLDEKGNFIVDSTPMAPPVGYKKQPSMVEMVRAAVRDENLKRDLAAAGMETFEEAEDFDIDDEPEFLRSPWENDFDPPLKEIIRAGQDEITKKERDKVSRSVIKMGDAPKNPPEAKEPPDGNPAA